MSNLHFTLDNDGRMTVSVFFTLDNDGRMTVSVF